MKSFLGWYWFLSGEENLLDHKKCGKWMHFFNNQTFAQEICQKAIDEKICYECKCTDMEETGTGKGVICFYLNGDDIENHKRVIQFMIDNNLIEKTKTGKFHNISFKFDSQTRSGEYGDKFEGKIKLEQFIDLQTGKWLSKEQDVDELSKNYKNIEWLMNQPIWGQLLYHCGYKKLTDDDQDVYLEIFGVMCDCGYGEHYYESDAFPSINDFKAACNDYRQHCGGDEEVDYLYNNAINIMKKYHHL